MLSAPPRVTLLFYRLSALFTLLTVSLGAVVCATRSGFDCHSWPGCYDDRFVPGPADIPAALVANPALEMVHRVTAMTTGAVLIVTVVLALLAKTSVRATRVLPIVAALAGGVSALFGRASVLGLGVTATGAAIDLLAALSAMSLALVAAVALRRGGRFVLNRVSSPALVASAVLVVMHVTGQLAAGDRSFTRCMSWPILWLAHDDNLGVQVARTALAVFALVATVVTVRVALRTPRLRGHGFALAGLLTAVLALAVAYRATGTDGGMLGITFSLASVALLWTLVLLCARAGISGPVESTPPAERRELERV